MKQARILQQSTDMLEEDSVEVISETRAELPSVSVYTPRLGKFVSIVRSRGRVMGVRLPVHDERSF
jgi:hypothetical protein